VALAEAKTSVLISMIREQRPGDSMPNPIPGHSYLQKEAPPKVIEAEWEALWMAFRWDMQKCKQ